MNRQDELLICWVFCRTYIMAISKTRIFYHNWNYRHQLQKSWLQLWSTLILKKNGIENAMIVGLYNAIKYTLHERKSLLENITRFSSNSYSSMKSTKHGFQKLPICCVICICSEMHWWFFPIYAISIMLLCIEGFLLSQQQEVRVNTYWRNPDSLPQNT